MLLAQPMTMINAGDATNGNDQCCWRIFKVTMTMLLMQPMTMVRSIAKAARARAAAHRANGSTIRAARLCFPHG